jgi:hypothetical protein
VLVGASAAKVVLPEQAQSKRPRALVDEASRSFRTNCRFIFTVFVIRQSNAQSALKRKEITSLSNHPFEIMNSAFRGVPVTTWTNSRAAGLKSALPGSRSRPF